MSDKTKIKEINKNFEEEFANKCVSSDVSYQLILINNKGNDWSVVSNIGSFRDQLNYSCQLVFKLLKSLWDKDHKEEYYLHAEIIIRHFTLQLIKLNNSNNSSSFIETGIGGSA